MKLTEHSDSSLSNISVTADLAVLCQVRADIYAVLARGYLNEVTPEYLEDLKTILPILLQVSQVTANQALIDGVRGLKELVDATGNQDEFLEDLSRAYATLFLVGRKEVTVNPCESVYISPEHLIMQDQRDQVMAFYACFGMGVVDTFNAPEDHISAELSFMSSMSSKSAEALRNSGTALTSRLLEAQLEFMQKHLLRWIEALVGDVKALSGDGFYYCLAAATLGFVHDDYASLHELICMVNEVERTNETINE